MAAKSAAGSKRASRFKGWARSKRKCTNKGTNVDELCRRILEGAPQPGSNPGIAAPPSDGWGYVGAEAFEELPLSEMTKKGLRDAGFVNMTAIQKSAVPHALAGRDVLGAAKTGSGKTLAFVIPVLEVLYRKRWCAIDGLGALIISPTKELATQIFEELGKVGRCHRFSAGLLIGGRNVDEEKNSVDKMNILVATPGRLLQHMDETYGFDAAALQVLVLDEADRILDLGFEKTMNAILDNLPMDRQTFLYSATQTKSVKDLARLSLSDPEYIAVHAESAVATPEKLNQSFVICELDEKMTVLWSFIRTHLKQKTIVFLSTCKQVRFAYEAFRRLKPGVPIGGLGGHMKLNSRMNMFKRFCTAKAMVLLATDVAARGLDFPKVDWVVQMDCPEDVETYIHRVGRTARYMSGGQGLLVLTPSEKRILSNLQARKIPIKNLKMRPSKLQSPTLALQGLVSKFPDIKCCAQRALVNYLKSVSLQPNKEIFKVEDLPIDKLAASFGLDSTPNTRAVKKLIGKAAKRKEKSEGFKKRGRTVDEDVKSVFESDAVTGDVRRKRQKKSVGEDKKDDQMDDMEQVVVEGGKNGEGGSDQLDDMVLKSHGPLPTHDRHGAVKDDSGEESDSSLEEITDDDDDDKVNGGVKEGNIENRQDVQLKGNWELDLEDMDVREQEMLALKLLASSS